jgi:DNA primase
MRILQERYGGPEISSEPGALEAEVNSIRSSYKQMDEGRITPQESDLAQFKIPWMSLKSPLSGPVVYLLQRGFNTRTLDSWQIGYDSLSDRITIPVHDENGNIVGIKGRAWRPEVQPRYISLGHQVSQSFSRYNFHTYHKSQFVYGLHKLSDVHTLLLVEGELNAMALHQMGMKNAVAVAGSEFSKRQCDLIVSNAEAVCIFFDQDLAGKAGAKKVAGMLDEHIPVSIVEKAHGDAASALEARTAYGASDVWKWVADARSWLEIYAGC